MRYLYTTQLLLEPLMCFRLLSVIAEAQMFHEGCALLTVGHRKAICGYGDGPSFVIVPIHLGGHAGRGTEIVRLAVGWICEVDVQVVGVHTEIVQRVELTPEKVVQKNFSNDES